MKSAALGVALFLLSGCLWAQEAPAPPPSPAGPHHHAMGAMHDQHMTEMKAQVEKMRATLNQMKAIAAKEKKSPEQQELQQNAELWDAMISHLEGMVKMMSENPGPGMAMGMMHGEGHGMGMSCCAGMKDGEAGMKEGGCCGGKCSKPAAEPPVIK
jgi:hypothetical protein